MITMQAIRRKYPDPVKFSYGYTKDCGKYCVGGAYIQYAGITLPDGALRFEHLFPASGNLAFALRQSNPALTPAKAWVFATKIMEFNDAMLFERAWASLDEALRWEP